MLCVNYISIKEKKKIKKALWDQVDSGTRSFGVNIELIRNVESQATM